MAVGAAVAVGVGAIGEAVASGVAVAVAAGEVASASGDVVGAVAPSSGERGRVLGVTSVEAGAVGTGAVGTGAVEDDAVGAGVPPGSGAVLPPQLAMSSSAAMRTARNGRERAPAMLRDANLRTPEFTRATVSHPRPAVRHPPIHGCRSALHGEPAMSPR